MNPAEFIYNALSPSDVEDVSVDLDEKTAFVVVPDTQLSLAIGKKGQNARLAAKLTGYKIDIKSHSKAEEMGYFDEQPEDENFDPYNEDEYYDEVSEDKDADAASFDIDETVDTNDEE